jgi:hypothetical protein
MSLNLNATRNWFDIAVAATVSSVVTLAATVAVMPYSNDDDVASKVDNISPILRTCMTASAVFFTISVCIEVYRNRLYKVQERLIDEQKKRIRILEESNRKLEATADNAWAIAAGTVQTFAIAAGNLQREPETRIVLVPVPIVVPIVVVAHANLY